jgi:integrase
MKGSVYKRKGKKTWEYCIDLDRGPNGKRNRKHGYGFTMKKEAEAEMRRIMHDIDRGRDPFPADMVFGPYSSNWLDHKRAEGLRETTIHRYGCLLRDEILPLVDRLQLREIRPAHARIVMDRMKERGLATATITQARAVFRGVMQQAVADQMIESNPVTAIKRPKQSRPKKAVPRPEQVKAVVELSKGTERESPISLGATTGGRRSEVGAVRWDDVDLAAWRMNVRQGLQWVPVGKDERGRTHRQLVFSHLKSEQAYRTVGLPAFVVERLQQHRKEQLERRLALGAAWADKWPTLDGGTVELNLVCDRGDGRPLDPDHLTKTFKKLAAQAGLAPDTTLHDLRHAALTQLGRDGIHPVIVCAIAGHSDPAFTMRVYQHAWEEGADEAATALGRALNL